MLRGPAAAILFGIAQIGSMRRRHKARCGTLNARGRTFTGRQDERSVDKGHNLRAKGFTCRRFNQGQRDGSSGERRGLSRRRSRRLPQSRRHNRRKRVHERLRVIREPVCLAGIGCRRTGPVGRRHARTCSGAELGSVPERVGGSAREIEVGPTSVTLAVPSGGRITYLPRVATDRLTHPARLRARRR